ncbi:glutathione S-transferase family protein [Parvularcula maris]|uniref:Glutathione S-transferase family protein n=1 Tax=Parvularcula maris TaxID=2965077 RepID=A0A9X2LBB2_9PROT|nr:glutathione S-transferase family protein [Parvularcula maris]MCQ8185377.1 glutathione S-transferase family protein [Parvularcula maris]
MTDLTLVIGNKNLSSWSLRPWLLMKVLEVPFREKLIRLDQPGSREELLKHSPSGLVPYLSWGEGGIGDSLAIAETVADFYPEKGIWPEDLKARACARFAVAEMHAGFGQLRGTWPMDMIREHKGLSCPPGVAKDLRRIAAIWDEALSRSGGPFLFGGFTAADAFYAPVVSRIRTYGPVKAMAPYQEYMDAVWSLPAMEEWREGAREEERLGWYE